MFDDPTPKDWVARRARCTAAELFRELRGTVEADAVSAREEVEGSIVDFGEDSGAFGVSRKQPREPSRVWSRSFHLEETKIVVKDEGADTVAEARVEFDGPHCWLKEEVTGLSFGLKGFSRLALEPLFFPAADVAITGSRL